MVGDGLRAQSGGDADALVAAATRLWPVPGRARIARRGAAGARDREYLLLPGAHRPRVLLPGGHRAAAATVARRTSSLTTGRERAIRWAVAAAARTGLVTLVARDRLVVEVEAGADSIERVLAGMLGHPVVVSPAVGTARANRKPVLHVLDGRGRTAAFVKVGDTAVAASLVAREAAALERLAGVGLRALHVPRVLHDATWNGMRLLVLSPVGGGRRRGPALPAAAMAEVARAGGRQRAVPAASPFWERVADAAAADERLAAVVESAASRWGADEVELGWSHGDWTPWNMAWVGETVHVWDWERFETSSPVGTDALHHRMQEHAQRAGDWDAAVSRIDADAADLLGAVGSADEPATVVGLYLLDLCCRYVVAGTGPLGRHLRPRAEWLLGVLEARLR